MGGPAESYAGMPENPVDRSAMSGLWRKRRNGEELTEGEQQPTYTNAFTAIPAGVQFRPERNTTKPRFYGTMNAKVDAAGIGQYAEIDDEGRIQIARFDDLWIANCYFPNGNGKNRDLSRIPYKLDFYRAVFERIERLRRREVARRQLEEAAGVDPAVGHRDDLAFAEQAVLPHRRRQWVLARLGGSGSESKRMLSISCTERPANRCGKRPVRSL